MLGRVEIYHHVSEESTMNNSHVDGKTLPRREIGILLEVFFFCLLLVVGQAVAQGIQQEKNVPMKTRDGALLRADIYRPMVDEKLPVLLQRNPYNKDRWESGSWSSHSPVRLANQGYVVIIQDTRGRYASDGDFYPFLHEIADGYDTVEWAGGLPYSNGKVGMFGSSYVGVTQWLASLDHPPHLAAVFPVMTSSDYYDGWIFRGGALEFWFSGSWTNMLAVHTMTRQSSRQIAMPKWMETLPLSDYPMAAAPNVSTLAPYFRDWLDHESDDEFWSRWSVEKSHSKLKVPAYHLGGWYDIFLQGTLKNFQRLKQLHPEVPHYLTIGPWNHSGPRPHRVGELDFGTESDLDTDGELLEWADLMLKQKLNRLTHRTPVRIFVMGKNVWRDEEQWPLLRAVPQNYFLHSVRGAQGASGDGVLDLQSPANELADAFTYDPSNPVPTLGGPLCCSREAINGAGPFDQNRVEARVDVLVYSTHPLLEEMEVTGPVHVVLYVGSDAPDTDFTAKLVDVHPDGRAYNLAEGILRMRRREGLARLAPKLQKDKVYRIEIDLVATSNVFTVGHRIRLEVSSSNFPRFDRNLNTGEPLKTARRMRNAHNRVFHTSSYPSHLVLPIVARRRQ